MTKVRVAVIGVGYLGRFHAQKYAQLQECELVAVVDARQEAREAVAREVGTRAVPDYREVLGQVGDTGSLKGAYLYFEIRHHGTPLNPVEWLGAK